MPTEQDDIFLLYHPLTSVTGPRLANYLGCPSGSTWDDNGEYEVLIRWGCRRPVASHGLTVLNTNSAIRATSNKFEALSRLDDAGISVPSFTTDEDEIGMTVEHTVNYPALGRDSSHSQGSDIDLILQQRDIELEGRSHHYVEYKPVAAEFRLHVFNGTVIMVHEKRLRTEESNSEPWMRNTDAGWVFVMPRSEVRDSTQQLAIDAAEELGLQFGAVDLIRDETGDEYVLEVNTAPALDEANMERYGEAIQRYTNLSTIAGLDNVTFDDDEE